MEKIFRETAPGTVEVKILPVRTVMMAESGRSYFDVHNGLFGRLFRYIQYNDVAMTVPVKADIEPGRMYFYLGSRENPEDLKALQEVVIHDNGKSLAVRTECIGSCGNVFKAVGVAVPPTIREL